jgi:hypothetical protein
LIIYNVVSPADSTATLSTAQPRYGIELNGATSALVGKQIALITISLRKTFTPSAGINVVIRRASDDAAVATSVETVNASVLTASFLPYTFTFSPAYTLQNLDKILVEYNSTGNVIMEVYTTDQFDGLLTRRTRFTPPSTYAAGNTNDIVALISDGVYVSLSRTYKNKIVGRISLTRVYKNKIFGRVSLSRIYKNKIATRVSLSRIYKNKILSRVSLSRIYKNKILARVSLARIYKNSILQRVSLSRIYKNKIATRVSLSRTYINKIIEQVPLTRISLERIYINKIVGRVSLTRTYINAIHVFLSRIPDRSEGKGPVNLRVYHPDIEIDRVPEPERELEAPMPRAEIRPKMRLPASMDPDVEVLRTE